MLMLSTGPTHSALPLTHTHTHIRKTNGKEEEEQRGEESAESLDLFFSLAVSQVNQAERGGNKEIMGEELCESIHEYVQDTHSLSCKGDCLRQHPR